MEILMRRTMEYDKTEQHPSYLRPVNLYHCGHEQCKPSHSFGPAIRPHFLIHYILQGTGSYYVDGKVYHLQGREGFLICPGVTTFYCADDKDPWEYCWIGFDGYDVPAILQECGLSPASLIFSDRSGGLLWKDILELIDLFTKRKGNEFTYLGQLYRCFSHMYLPPENSSKLVYEAQMDKALEYIHNNYSYEIAVTDIANYLCIDRSYLYKIFMKHINVSPQQYLINYRLSISQKLLKDTSLSITEIAYSCGFKDASSFDKHFKKYSGITPNQYRSGKFYADAAK
jgi:AraC-like DNA-binding protein